MTKSSVRFTARLLLVTASFWGCAEVHDVDILIRGGTIYNGSGGDPFIADVALAGDTILAIGDLRAMTAKHEIDASGMAVAPGFINMLSWATESLIHDGDGQSDIRQGVTLEIFGEGESMGPLNDAMKKDMVDQQGDIRFDVTWTTLGEYLQHLEDRGIGPNVASFVGATTLRIHEIGHEDRSPTADEMGRMQDQVREAMEEGALGVGSSLIYAPAFYATTEELIALAEVAANYGGIYISHLRSEGNRLMEAVDELITIAREAAIPAQIYHLKAAGKDNWNKLDAVIRRVEQAQSEGLAITADMYTYTAGATGLDAAMPPWVQEGGYKQWAGRLQDPAIRREVISEMTRPSDAWENWYHLAGDPSRIILVGFKADSLKYLTGKSLQEVAALRGTSPEETVLDLVIQDGSRVGTVYFVMSEDNIRKKVALPWVTFDSDAGALATEGAFLKSNPHPRAYGNFARLLGRYVRDEQIITLQEAIRRLTSLPANTLLLRQRGELLAGNYADVVIFDPATISDHATFDKPHQYATGMEYVFVNGVPVLMFGEPTGATPGRFVKGPGWKGWH